MRVRADVALERVGYVAITQTGRGRGGTTDHGRSAYRRHLALRKALTKIE